MRRYSGEMVLPPDDFSEKLDRPTVFLAGAIDMGEAEDWQAKLAKALEDVDCTILNPRRLDWDKTWKQEMSFGPFREQVEWELSGLDAVDVVAVGLPAGSKAPISLMELGLHARNGSAVVWCPEGYWRKGNVDIVCARYGVPVFEDFDEFAAEVVERLRVVRIASRVAGKKMLDLMKSIRKPMPPPTSKHERKDKPSRKKEKDKLRQHWG